MTAGTRNTVFACYAAMVTLSVTMNLMPVYLTSISESFGGAAGLSKEQLGRVGACTFLGLVLGLLVTGPLADRWGARPFTVLGNLLVGAGLGLLGFCRSYEGVLAAVLVAGFGAGILDMILSPVVCALQPERRAAAMNWLHSFYAVGAALTLVVAIGAIRLGIDWHRLALGLTAFPALVALAFGFLPVPSLLAEGGVRLRLRDLARRPFFLAVTAAILLAGATELGMAQWLPAYAELNLGLSRAGGAWALLAFSVAMAVGRMATGSLDRRISIYAVLLASCGSSVVLFGIASFCPLPAGALMAAVLVGFAGSCLWPSTLGIAADRYPEAGGTMFGFLAAVGNFGGIVMPWGVGAVADRASLPLGLAASGLCPLLLFFLVLWMRKRATGTPHARAEGPADAY